MFVDSYLNGSTTQSTMCLNNKDSVMNTCPTGGILNLMISLEMECVQNLCYFQLQSNAVLDLYESWCCTWKWNSAVFYSFPNLSWCSSWSHIHGNHTGWWPPLFSIPAECDWCLFPSALISLNYSWKESREIRTGGLHKSLQLVQVFDSWITGWKRHENYKATAVTVVLLHILGTFHLSASKLNLFPTFNKG